MKLKLASILFLMSIPAISFAMAKSSIIDLTGGVAKPKSNVTIALDSLLRDVSYTVQCTIRSDGVSNQPTDIIRAGSNSVTFPITYILNGQDINSRSQFKLPTKSDADFQALYVEWTGSPYKFAITIYNDDDQDTVTVSKCTATPT